MNRLSSIQKDALGLVLLAVVLTLHHLIVSKL